MCSRLKYRSGAPDVSRIADTAEGSADVSLERRIAIAVLFGVAAALVSYVGLASRGYLASDFEWPLRAARALLAGQNPYQVIVGGGAYPFDTPFYYPLPAALVALPLVGLNPYVAGALFFGISSAAMAFGLSNGPVWRLLMFATPSFLVAAQVAQWSPLMVAAALVPALQGFAVCKPTIGFGAFLFRPTFRGILGGAALFLISLAVLPVWPFWWLHVTLTSLVPHPAPLMVLPGFLLVLSILAWRSREGRLLIAMSVLPQLLFWYDQMLLFLIPRTARQMAAFVGASWLGYGAWFLAVTYLHEWANMYGTVDLAAPFVIVTVYLPALDLVLIQYLEDRKIRKGQAVPDPTSTSRLSLPRRLVAIWRHSVDH